MGLRPTRSDADAAGRFRRINDLDRVFNGAVRKEWQGCFIKSAKYTVAQLLPRIAARHRGEFAAFRSPDREGGDEERTTTIRPVMKQRQQYWSRLSQAFRAAAVRERLFHESH